MRAPWKKEMTRLEQSSAKRYDDSRLPERSGLPRDPVTDRDLGSGRLCGGSGHDRFELDGVNRPSVGEADDTSLRR